MQPTEVHFSNKLKHKTKEEIIIAQKNMNLTYFVKRRETKKKNLTNNVICNHIQEKKNRKKKTIQSIKKIQSIWKPFKMRLKLYDKNQLICV